MSFLKGFKTKEKINTTWKKGMSGGYTGQAGMLLHLHIHQLYISPTGFSFINFKLPEAFYQRQ
jgi:hypothetical protein